MWDFDCYNYWFWNALGSVYYAEWKTNHTVIDGRRMYFDGNGASLFGHWVIWYLLCFITLGIYGFWLTIKMEQWKAKHTHFIED